LGGLKTPRQVEKTGTGTVENKTDRLPGREIWKDPHIKLKTLLLKSKRERESQILPDSVI
jgi:hypothetical protein